MADAAEREWTGLDWVEFEAPLEPLVWGRSTYVVLRVPVGLEVAARHALTRRVEGTVEDVEVNLGINRADVLPDAFAYAGRSLQRRTGAAAGDVVACRLRPADPDLVPLPDDVREALAGAGRLEAFELRRPAERRRLLAEVDTAATDATRRRRVARLVSDS